MTRRSFGLVLALLFAATPVFGVVCEVDCEQPLAASPRCHEGSVPHEGQILRGTAHDCDHDHRGATPALLTSILGRDAGPASFEITLAALVSSRSFVIRLASAAAMHGPPGPSGGTPSSHIIVLRI